MGQTNPTIQRLGEEPVIFEVLWQRGALLVVNKPPGIVTHRSAEARDRWDALRCLREQLGCWVYLPHRLDRKTSGALIVSLDEQLGAELSRAFQDRLIQKKYWAIVRGWIPAAGRLDYPLRDEDSGLMQAAVTVYRPLGSIEIPVPVKPHPTARYSLVEAAPETGRRHQIRRHLRHLSHPIIGDTRHGEADHNRVFRERWHWHRMFLHALRVGFKDPQSGDWVEVEAPLEAEFAAACHTFGWSVSRHGLGSSG